jgi:hypothetical protein
MFFRSKTANLAAPVEKAPMRKPFAGPGYIILNVMRVLNIIALALVVVASWVMLVKTFVVSKVLFLNDSGSKSSNKIQFFFFDAVSHLVLSIISRKFIVLTTFTKH